MDSCAYRLPHHRYDCLVAAGVTAMVDGRTNPLEEIDAFCQQAGWKFAHLSYALKNRLFPLHPKPDPIGFSDFSFFIPAHVLYIVNDRLHIESEDPDSIYKEIILTAETDDSSTAPITVQQRLTKEEYLKKIGQLQQHIHRGDCYEINFCQEFYAGGVRIDPVILFQQLIRVSPNPFSVLYKNNDQYLLCASPERFIQRSGDVILSQPIKGTEKRDRSDPEKDAFLGKALRQSAKDQAENVMVVDLVRNDLSRICKRDTVEVEELFGIYSFPQVHQMISTVKGILKRDITFSQIIEALFPMGSMTGAPKYRVLQLIDEYESGSRGIFSGSVGYIDPKGDFDFNVIIRSIMYNRAASYLSYQVGSGITIYSDPVCEWEECLLKAAAIQAVLSAEVIA
jgi:para-aminobenzoate synthetase component 1